MGSLTLLKCTCNARRKNCDLRSFGPEGVIHHNTVFRSFNNGNMGLADEPRSGHPAVADDDILLE